jgi:hypothetical protein
MIRARLAVVALAATLATPAVAGEMTPEQARHFVVGKVFTYSCFEGTAGAGRIQADGSVAGTIQLQGSGPVRRAALPAGTLRVKGDKVCASVKGLPFEPCFKLERTSAKSFRGSLSGFGFAYCDFVHKGRRGRHILRSASRQHNKPVALRSTLTE